MKSMQELIVSVVLDLPYADARRALDTDACDVRVGCVLLQEAMNKMEESIEFRSRTLTSAGCVFDSTQQDFLANVLSVLLLGPYLEGTIFTLKTDHDSSEYSICRMQREGSRNGVYGYPSPR